MPDGGRFIAGGGKSAWIFGPQSDTNVQPAATGLRIQSSILGKVRPIGCGQTRIALNLIDYMDFKSFQQDVGGGKGGLGGGGKGGGSQFNYQVVPLFAGGEGPIIRIISITDQNGIIHPGLGPWNLSLKLGDYAQTAFGYIVSNHPDRALNYRGLWLIGSFPMFLGTNSSLPNFTPEVLWGVNGGAPGIPDADPADWVTNYLTNVHWGVQFPPAFLGSLTQYSDWCVATGMLISDSLTERQAANSYLQSLMEATSSEFVWSGRKLTIVPYGDVVVTGNGRTFTPNLTPLFDLDDSVLMPNTSGGGSVSVSTNNSDPVQGARKRQADVLNDILVEYLDRTNNYNPTIVQAKNEADEVKFQTRPSDTKSHHFFCMQDAALISAHLYLSRQKVRNTYSITVPRNYIWLDPMDIVTINDPSLGLVQWPVRIKEITENQQDFSLTMLVEDLAPGSGTPFNYDSETACCIGAQLPFNTDPGPTVFAYWDATLCGVVDGPGIIIAGAGAAAPITPHPGIKGVISAWYHPDYFATNPTVSGDQTIFDTVTGVSDEVKLSGHFQGSGADVQIKLAVTFTPGGGGTQVTRTVVVSVGPQASIPANGFAIIAAWDLSTTTSNLQIRVNAGTKVVATHSESASMDVTHPLFEANGGTYSMGDNLATSQMIVADLWIGLDSDIDGLIPIDDVMWAKFFCGVGGGALAAPKDKGVDGAKPQGCPPTFFFMVPSGTGHSAGESTGCLSGDVLTTIIGGGSVTGNTSGIPACGSYHGHGMHFAPNTKFIGKEPFGPVRQIWGSAAVYISTDAGISYHKVGVLPGPSPIGKLTANYAIGSDPDTVHTLSVDLSESFGSLESFSASDADAGRTRSVIGSEIIDFSDVTLTAPNKYDLDTYIRRGQLGTTIAAHVIGDTFAVLGNNALVVNYPVSMIGSTIHVKFQAVNIAGGGLQDLASVTDHVITLTGPAVPSAPASITVAQSGDIVASSWPVAAGCGVTGYDFETISTVPVTVDVLSNANQQSVTIIGMAPGVYTFQVRARNAAGASGWTSTSFTVT